MEGSLVSLIFKCLIGISTRRTVEVRILKFEVLDLIISISIQYLGVGVVPRPISHEIPDITEIQKAEISEDQDCFYSDPDINQMRIQVSKLKQEAPSPNKI